MLSDLVAQDVASCLREFWQPASITPRVAVGSHIGYEAPDEGSHLHAVLSRALVGQFQALALVLGNPKEFQIGFIYKSFEIANRPSRPSS